MSITKKEAYFNSSDGIHKIRTLIWLDEAADHEAIFQIAHGVAEHIDRYDEFARFMASNGYVVCGMDFLGHGKSVNSPIELGDIPGKDGHIRLVDDMHILANIMHKRYPTLPYFLFGHSMGSFAARLYASIFGYELCGLCLSGTGQLPAVTTLLDMPIDLLVKKLGEDSSLGNVFGATGKLQSLSFKNETGDDLAWLSRDKANRERYRADPLCGFNLNAGGLQTLANLAIKASDDRCTNSFPACLRVLLVSGAKDPIGNNGRGVLTFADRLENAGICPDVILYPGDRHEILNENDRETVYNDILKWANQAML